MPIWKITEKGPTKIPETRIKEENLLEKHIEDWIVSDPTLLGEYLFLIGRQVLIPDTKDKLDLLALDPYGNAVIIELKRGHLKDLVDVQSLRYASYISKWQFEDFENQARIFLKKIGDPEFNFNSLYEEFCNNSVGDEIPNINQDQRLIIVGSSVREKLGTVALWLREHSVDISVIEVHAFKQPDGLLIQPTVIVPHPVKRFSETGKTRPKGTPWLVDGKEWHLEKRCSPNTKEMFLKLDKTLQDNFEFDGPRWNQKYYVSYRVNNYNWLSVNTNPGILRLNFLLKPGKFDVNEIANRLGIAKFDKESFSEKINLPSSVLIQSLNDSTDRIIIRIKEGFDIESETFRNFLDDAYKAFSK